jgi:hypothetical protein
MRERENNKKLFVVWTVNNKHKSLFTIHTRRKNIYFTYSAGDVK